MIPDSRSTNCRLFVIENTDIKNAMHQGAKDSDTKVKLRFANIFLKLIMTEKKSDSAQNRPPIQNQSLQHFSIPSTQLLQATPGKETGHRWMNQFWANPTRRVIQKINFEER